MNRPVNVRRPEVMAQVAEDLAHFQSPLVEAIRQQGNELELPGDNPKLHQANTCGLT